MGLSHGAQKCTVTCATTKLNSVIIQSGIPFRTSQEKIKAIWRLATSS